MSESSLRAALESYVVRYSDDHRPIRLCDIAEALHAMLIDCPPDPQDPLTKLTEMQGTLSWVEIGGQRYYVCHVGYAMEHGGSYAEAIDKMYAQFADVTKAIEVANKPQRVTQEEYDKMLKDAREFTARAQAFRAQSQAKAPPHHRELRDRDGTPLTSDDIL